MIIPIGTNIRMRRTPYVTYTLIALNGLAYVATLIVYFSSGCSEDSLKDLFQKLGFIPAQPQWYALLTSMFTHDAPMPFHLLFNMVYLWLFGRHIEDALGAGIYLIFYLGSQLGAIFLQSLMTKLFMPPEVMMLPNIGASGAIAALLGLFTVRFYHSRVTLFYFFFFGLLPRTGTFELPVVAALVFWFSQQLFFGFISLYLAGGGVAYWAHVGGYLFGLAAALLFGAGAQAQYEQLWDEAEEALAWGNYRAAAHRYSRLVRWQSNNAVAHLNLARCYFELGQLQLAITHLTQGIKLAKTASLSQPVADLYLNCRERIDASALPSGVVLDIATCLEQVERYREAAEILLKFVEGCAPMQQKEMPLIRYADLSWKRLHNPQAAQQALITFLQHFPASQWTSYAKQMLQQLGG